MKIIEMADVFLNLANFAQHTLLTLAPLSGYTLNLQALIKVSKVSGTSPLSYKVLWKENSEKRNFNSLKKYLLKATVQLGLNLELFVCSRVV